MKNSSAYSRSAARAFSWQLCHSGSCKCQLERAGRAQLGALVWLLSESRHNYWQAEFIGVTSLSHQRTPEPRLRAPGISGHISSRWGRECFSKQEEDLHVIIISACQQSSQLDPTKHCGCINFNCKSLLEWGKGGKKRVSMALCPVLPHAACW